MSFSEEEIITLAIAAVILLFPLTRHALDMLTTMFHETGHALVCVVTGGRVNRIDLFANTGGLTTYRPRGKVSQFFTVAAGYTTPPVIAVVGAALVADARYTAWGVIVLGTIVVNAVLWVRNAYGAVFLVLAGGALSWLMGWGSVDVGEWVAVLLVLLLMVSAVLAAWTVFKVSIGRRNPDRAGSDPGQLAKITGVHPAVWGSFFLVFAVGGLVLGLVLMTTNEASRVTASAFLS